MLKLNTKLKYPLFTITFALGGFFLFQYLTFIPEYSNATTIETPVYDDSKVDTRTLSDITYMQEMTSGICKRSVKNESKQLIDGRDGKHYWVTKLVGPGGEEKNGCWMTQNLDFDLWNEETNEPIVLKVDNLNFMGTDIEKNWESTSGRSVLWADSGSETVKYYDPGYYLYKGFSLRQPASRDLAYGKASENLTLTDAHYLQGNYYSFNAATAGKGANFGLVGKDEDVRSSICPKGWRLPTALSDDGVSFNFLNTVSTTKIFSSPYFFINSGFVNGGLLDDAFAGRYWSSTAYAYRDDAYDWGFADGDEWPALGIIYRYEGKTIRCVARDDTEDVETPGIDNPNTSVTVPNIITLDVSNNVNIETNTNTVNEGSFTASVSSNAPYSISLSTTDGGHTDLRNDNTNSSIPALNPTSNITESSSKWWGIKCTNSGTSTGCTKTTYTGLTNHLTPTLFYTSTQSTSNQLTHFTIGIQTSPDLPSGTYSTSILVTASQN